MPLSFARRFIVTVSIGVAAVLIMQLTQGMTAQAEEDEYITADDGVLVEPVKPVEGPRLTVFVGSFEAQGAFTSEYGDWPVGAGLSAMLVTALRESGQFILVERAQLKQILSEQELASSGLTRKEGQAQTGNLQNAQIAIYGAVTEFGAAEKGGGFSLGASSGPFGGGMSQQKSTTTVAFDVRMVDTTSGEIVDSFAVKEKIKNTSFDISGGYKGIDLGTNQFYNTPLGQASRAAITKAVQKIAKNARKVSWTTLVVDYEDQELYLNAGSNARVFVGDQFLIERVVKRFTDPATGETIGIRKKKLGSVTLTGVEERMSWGTFAPISETMPERGDLVVREGR